MHPFFVFTVAMFFVLLWFVWTRIKGAEYWPTRKRRATKALDMLGLKKQDIFYDLGCGFGGVVAMAAQKCKTAVGIELDPLRAAIACARTSRYKNAKIKLGNFLNADISDANTIFLFLKQGVNQKLKSKLEKLKRGTRIVSHNWTFEGWKPCAVDARDKLYLYVIGKSNK